MSPSRPVALHLPSLLIGEGKEEVLFFRALMDSLGIHHVHVEAYAGKAKLAAFLETLPTWSGFEKVSALGITQDADESAQAATDRVAGAVATARASSPKLAALRVETHVLPGLGRRGALEHLVLEALDSRELSCVDQFRACVNGGELHDNQQDRAKSRLLAWLATRLPPDHRLGEAALAGLIPLTNPCFDSLKTFLRSL